ncbi:serine--tRNA ligase [Candidatus Woesearchaeota archaeon]|nr:serine--tRNA ligase [Candidatus Woesearchaeota archaeon]
MLDIKLIRENPDLVRQDLEKRRDEKKLAWLDDLIAKDDEARKLKQELDSLKHSRNRSTLEINELKKKGQDFKGKVAEAQETGRKVKEAEERLEMLNQKIRDYLMRLPNILHESVPYGRDDSENAEIKKVGKPRIVDFELKSHAELAESLGAADFERSTKLAGAGFYFLKGDLALLNQALIRYAIDLLVERGYVLIEPPLMMNRKAYEGVTDLADFENVMYKIEGEDAYMIATSEHPMAGMFMNEIIPEKNLPIKFVGYSMCFRKEIGSHGVDTRGLFRTHQFNKVEQFIFCKPEESWKFHEELLKNSEDIFTGLGLPYRVVNICTGDIGVLAAKKYDVEAWMLKQQQYKEVCSCSNCTDYQARRLNIRFGMPGMPNQPLVHTLNNTAIATGRALVAILENYQNADGSVTIPDALQKYMNGKTKIKPVK